MNEDYEALALIAEMKKEIGDLRILIAKHDAMFVALGSEIIQKILSIKLKKDVPEKCKYISLYKCKYCALEVTEMPEWEKGECPKDKYQHHFKVIRTDGPK